MAPVLAAAAAGLVLSFALERLMKPRPLLSRPSACWAVHVGLWLIAFGGLALLLGRPWFAAATVTAFLLLLVLVNNAKMKALREPFVFQDYEYFLDVIRHPRLYFPFMGNGQAFVATVGFLLAAWIGFMVETVPDGRYLISGQLGGISAVLLIGTLLFAAGTRQSQAVSFQPERDVVSLGLLTSLWRYAMEGRQRPSLASPFQFVSLPADSRELPHLVALQSESFFDPRPLYSGIRQEILKEFDRFKMEAVAHGRLKVPAWGANTVRTEFAFLSGVDEARLGVHRFNPFKAVAAGWNVFSLAHYLKHLGYRAVAIHPYPASFYQRDRVYPRLGFDELLDIREFSDAERFGPYVSDAAVAKRIEEVLESASSPVFVFAITMENHGPLHLEKPNPEDLGNLYTVPPPTGCDDLTIYLRHLRNADRMIGSMRQEFERCDRGVGFCWFGDHVPIMPAVYDSFGLPDGNVEYVFWDSRARAGTREQRLVAHQLSALWLRSMGLIKPEPIHAIISAAKTANTL